MPSLPSCMTQGKTVEEAMESVNEAIEIYLDGLDSEDDAYEHR